jgi:diamine N-acetyltransferase
MRSSPVFRYPEGKSARKPAMSQLRLFSPTCDDAGALAELGRRTFVETFGTLYQPADTQAFLEQVHSLSAVLAELADPGLHFQLAELDGELVGYIKVGKVHVPVPSPSSAAQELRQLYVLEKHTGKGIGKRLMGWAEQKFAALGADEVYISVFSENHRAIGFYRSFGFEKIGEYGFKVGNQVDLEWIMRRPGNPDQAGK